VACKWGIDEDVVRAQTAKESYWFQRNVGDFTTDTSRCVPGHELGEDGREGECPESIGMMPVRYPYFVATIADAVTSTAYNLDIAYAVWRTCFEGEEEWLGEVDAGREYAAGDMWGCVGRWFAGRWYTDPAIEYMTAVQDYYEDRIWERRDFITYTG
jgi:autotransporter family porin